MARSAESGCDCSGERILRNRATPPTSRVCSCDLGGTTGSLTLAALYVAFCETEPRRRRGGFVRAIWGHDRLAYARGSVCGILRNRATPCAVVGLFVRFAEHEPYSIVKDPWAEPLTRMPLGAADYAKRSESQYRTHAPLVGGREFPCVRVADSEGKAEPPPVRDCLFCCD